MPDIAPNPLHVVGVRRDTVAIPPIAENTVEIMVGVLTIGIEHRALTDALVDQHYEQFGAEGAKFVEASRERRSFLPLDDTGISFHVCDAESGFEYLRFDAFAEDPHYHYIYEGGYFIVVRFDENAHGSCLEWIYSALRSRLPDMLTYAGAGELAAKVRQEDIDAAFPEIVATARKALALA
jgi:hypothetical protein